MAPPAPAFLRSCNSLPPTPLEVERAPRPGQKGREMRPGWRSTRNSKLGRRESPRRWTWAARRQPCAGRSIERQRGGFRKATTVTRDREFIQQQQQQRITRKNWSTLLIVRSRGQRRKGQSRLSHAWAEERPGRMRHGRRGRALNMDGHQSRPPHHKLSLPLASMRRGVAGTIKKLTCGVPKASPPLTPPTAMRKHAAPGVVAPHAHVTHGTRHPPTN